MALRAFRAIRKANLQEAQLFLALTKRSFTTGGKSNGITWPKLSEATIRKKGSSKPLIDKGELKNSITIIRSGENIFIGIPSGKRHTDRSKPMTQIGHVHEYGELIAQQRGSKVVLIRIPERSFLRSTEKFHFKPGDFGKRIEARVAIAMGRGWAVQAPLKMSALAKAGVAVAKGK
jgi:hypothetical protein